MLSRFADRLILCPTREPLQTEGKLRRQVEFAGGALELWNPLGREHRPGEADLYILKFGGTASRAERATPHPAEAWEDLKSEVWAVNPPGYGGSPGRASLRLLAAAAEAAYLHVRERAGERPILVTGNSLGTAYALFVAAKHRVDGLILRNPPPLRQIIVGQYGWWNGFVGAMLIAAQTPRELDSIANAARSQSPGVILSSQRDRAVPVRYQRLILEAYAGQKQILELPGADHADPLTDDELLRYRELLGWLRGEMTRNAPEHRVA
jgi:pimeloyl-ACP methyl ester carboxylesterase